MNDILKLLIENQGLTYITKDKKAIIFQAKNKTKRYIELIDKLNETILDYKLQEFKVNCDWGICGYRLKTFYRIKIYLDKWPGLNIDVLSKKIRFYSFRCDYF
jgi:hypothetical protein